MLNVLLAIIPDDEMPPIFLLAERDPSSISRSVFVFAILGLTVRTSYRGQMSERDPRVKAQKFQTGPTTRQRPIALEACQTRLPLNAAGPRYIWQIRPRSRSCHFPHTRASARSCVDRTPGTSANSVSSRQKTLHRGSGGSSILCCLFALATPVLSQREKRACLCPFRK